MIFRMECALVLRFYTINAAPAIRGICFLQTP